MPPEVILLQGAHFGLMACQSHGCGLQASAGRWLLRLRRDWRQGEDGMQVNSSANLLY